MMVQVGTIQESREREEKVGWYGSSSGRQIYTVHPNGFRWRDEVIQGTAVENGC